MSVETSKQPENSSSQLSREITEGKRKWVSYREGLSLQDVFSDSGSAIAAHRKHLACPKNGQEKGAQLEGKVKRKQPGDRIKLEQNQKRRIKLQAHVTAMEYEMLNDQFRATGIRYFLDYLRLLILDKKRLTISPIRKN
jgi:hypothetical protein